ncbi:MAG: GntR family transcriptional regulator [Gemmatimonadetes bacterium]|nr:GntR family transcriptional regulator [Gemmatimonadota bacterium]
MPARRSAPRPHRDRAAEAYAKVQDLIVRGALAPGERITEADVSSRLGVSRTPVREAIQRLLYEGYLALPRDGRRAQAVISPLTKDDARDMWRIIGALEGLAGYDAALLDKKRRARIVERMRTANRYLKAQAKARFPNKSLMYDLDQEFHRSYVEGAASARLLALHRAIKPHHERYERVYVSMLAGRIRKSVREHDAIIRAIAAGRPQAAERAVLVNWRNGAALMHQMIEARGERGIW